MIRSQTKQEFEKERDDFFEFLKENKIDKFAEYFRNTYLKPYITKRVNCFLIKLNQTF